MIDAATEHAAILGRRIAGKVPVDAPPRAIAIAVGQWFKDNIRYIEERPETWVSLPTLLELKAGDCDDTAPAILAILIRMNWRPAWGIGFDAKNRARHIWARVQQKQGAPWIDLDPTSQRLPMGSSPLALRSGLRYARAYRLTL